MSILEDQDYGASDLLRCKLIYLQKENTWMKRQYNYLCKLIDTQKKIIHAPLEEAENLQKHISSILNERSEYFASLNEQPEVKRRLCQISSKQIQIQEFVPMIYSFQEKIERLQNQIQKRESHLQSVEVLKNLQNNEEKKSEMRFINSFQTHSRLLQKIKKEISNLKTKKEYLETNLLQISEKTFMLESTLNSRSKVSQCNHNPVEQDQSSIFQKVVLLIRKKKYQNDCLQQKAKKIRNSLARKKAINIKLQNQIQNSQWKCFQNIAACGYVQGHENPDVSMFGQSFVQNHNASFSFDVSRFIRPKQN